MNYLNLGMIAIGLLMFLWLFWRHQKTLWRLENVYKELYRQQNENESAMSAMFQVQKLLHTEGGGIYKRISENKEILSHVNESNSKVLTDTNVFWLLDAHHQFFISLVYLSKELGIESPADFKMFSSLHDIDNIEIFEMVGRKLDERPFVVDRLNELKNGERKK